MLPADTIVAHATPPGVSAIGLIRLSGTQARQIAARLCDTLPPIRMATHLTLRADDGEILDDAVVTCWQAPASYTGEDVVEFSCHGNPVILEAVLRACINAGARAAQPGEFTQRAFLNGKMDLTRAEAVCDLIHAGSHRALRAAHQLRQGVLATKIAALKEELLQVLAHLEAYIDFPEEDIQPETGAAWIARIRDVCDQLRHLLATAPEGHRLREGFNIVLAGAPNAGKSSLLNNLLQRERAIVSPTPGTTRDTVEDQLTLEGIRLRLIDTAGLRHSDDPVEQLGISRTNQALDTADLIVWVENPASPAPPPDGYANKANLLRCYSHSDLGHDVPSQALSYSSLSGNGVDAIRAAIASRLHLDTAATAHESVAINARHETHLQNCLQALERAMSQAAETGPLECTSSDLRQALDELALLTGETTNEDILDRLFQQFCIGK